MRTLALLSLLALALAGCGSPCDSSNCAGCCDAAGACQLPTPQHCGLNGAACAACPGVESCQLGQCVLPGHTGGGSGTSSGNGSTGSSSSGTSAGSTSGTTTGGGSTTSGTTGLTTTSTGGASSTSTTGSTSSTSTTSTSTTSSGSTTSTGSTSTTSTTGSTGSSGTSSTGSTTSGSTTSGSTTSGTSSTSTSTSTSGSSTTGSTTGGVCPGFQALPQLSGPGTQVELFGNADGSPDYTSSCSADPFTQTPTAGPSNGFTFTTPSLAILSASVSSLDGGVPVLSLTTGCGNSEVEQSCAGTALFGGGTFQTQRLPAGTYNVRVTGPSYVFGGSGTGEYDLQVSLGVPVPNDTCSGAIALALDGGAATVTVDTTSAINDSVTQPTGACGSYDSNTGTYSGTGNGPDVVYAVTVGAGTLTATLTPLSTSITPVLSIRSAPCINNFDDAGATTATEVGCALPADGGSYPVQVSRSVSAGTYYLWVDSYSGTMGPMRLDVQAH